MHDPGKRKAREAEAPAEIIVTVDEKALADMGAIAKRLEKAGLAVEHVLDITGQVTGRCAGADIEALRDVEGVVDVSVSRGIQLPPPGSVIQ